ncbi:outer-membrane lipoprotein carrier protein [Ameyamaea chiangmaiensis NBRC 103196]|uniref:Outer membrane lipoprotein carrier protein LolA n=1 Tax=Ameyamaea chiangmaiensis TaxID=442969 RepID=A0A850PFA3_9PROT|nr:outer membrane lipoprotein carrier protein LolA [Ameyamaea chiangmaiensis]MBS4075290.1 outer membrane lipoprotein carrier protein LolA [Ameyamaea chiangmaiensis]NVN41513.1 outer membrane lipoprotein carrier protein LolA [Ameyamaea chiangmaiensis]GBQ66667.1 outer-membrane lipoprotein carrier protein [Ameyamaea chiangmaiensis NBRC 103196]
MPALPPPVRTALCALSLLVAGSVVAPVVPRAATPTLTAPDQQTLSRIEATLNAITTLKARFQQIAPDNARTTGTAWLDRPGRMRFAYDKPSQLLLVANDGKVVFHDGELGQTTTIPLERTPLGLLLRPGLRFSGDVAVTGFDRSDGLIRVTLVRAASPGDGSLTLVFNQQPLALRSWSVIDAQGRETHVDLFDVHLGVPVTADLFVPPAED